MTANQPDGIESLAAEVRGITAPVTELLGNVDWAEAAIAAARRRHPEHADRIWHAFPLLIPTQDRMRTEFVYRSHAAELLDRVAAGHDTRPGTAAEVCCALMQTSQLASLRSSASGLYMRMWQQAGFPHIPELTEAGRHHEALERSVIDDHEQYARQRLAVPERHLGDINCTGYHHGETVACVYAQARSIEEAA